MGGPGHRTVPGRELVHHTYRQRLQLGVAGPGSPGNGRRVHPLHPVARPGVHPGRTAAASAKAAASAYEAAKAAVAHPIEIVINRQLMTSLAIHNFFGLNAPAIAAKEIEYQEMWARNISAMLGYFDGASAAAAQLSPWENALAGLTGQVSAAAEAASPITTALQPLINLADEITDDLEAAVQTVTAAFKPFTEEILKDEAQLEKTIVNAVRAGQLDELAEAWVNAINSAGGLGAESLKNLNNVLQRLFFNPNSQFASLTQEFLLAIARFNGSLPR